MQLHSEIVLYIVLGLFAFILNLPVIFTVLFNSQLRLQKEFVIIAGLCITDSINGFIFFLIGVYRWRVVVEAKEIQLTSRWFCLTTIPQMTSVAIDQAFAWMLLVITLDRLFAVCSPVHYFKQTGSYAWKCHLGVLAQSILCLGFAFVFTKDYTYPEVSPLCYTSDSVDPKLYRVLEIMRMATVALSVVLYVPIGWNLSHISQNKNLGTDVNRRYKQLKNMTVTIALCTATSVILVLIPDIAVSFKLFNLKAYSSYFFSVTILKSSINVLIYVIRNPLIYRKLLDFIFRFQRKPSVQPTSSHFTIVHNSPAHPRGSLKTP
ncbi:hypothetical protein L596_018041 [Steinernema carpocapsae]|uniref:G-protein coupled receptors family 1 profile domain-containing protein n=1 Tax=Steinernema carpocapsae TaxID=34508 RepID=A0A4U5N3G1_STECR|nr:hypothetical protein L596_018041 [Steinernema carpocapsae]